MNKYCVVVYFVQFEEMITSFVSYLYIAREQKYENCSRNDNHYVFVNKEIKTSGICYQSQRNIYYNYTLKYDKNSIYFSNCGGFIFLRDINLKIT